jgi:hypothetical protein
VFLILRVQGQGVSNPAGAGGRVFLVLTRAGGRVFLILTSAGGRVFLILREQGAGCF